MTNEAYEWLQQTSDAFTARVTEELGARWRAWKLDLTQNEVFEVVGALLARQCSLAIGVARSPHDWTAHLVPIVLRAMADVHINLGWILRDPLERSRRFIYFGLGQEKLHLEHLESQGIDNETTRSQRAWIDAQRYTFLTEVNVGAWSETPVRKMAEEAGLLDFYRFRYHPLSAAAHSMWNHVAKFNLRPCVNPLHRYHQVPEIPDLPPDIGLWDMAAGLLQETFALFDAAFSISVDLTTSAELLDQALADYARSRRGDQS